MNHSDVDRDTGFRAQYRALGGVRRFVNNFFGFPPFRPQDRLPPKLPGYKLLLLWTADIAFVLSSVYITYICLTFVFKDLYRPSCSCYLYVSGLLLLLSFIIDRVLRNRRHVHEERLEDRSEVDALLVEAEGVRVRSWLHKDGTISERPINANERKIDLMSEVTRLDREGPHTWTEYQIVPLYQMLVAFLTPNEVVARTRSLLAEIEDYAYGSEYRYESKNFDRLKDAVDAATLKIRNVEEQIARKKDEHAEFTASESVMLDDAANTLRAELYDMYDHLAGYQLEWAQGSALIRALLVCGAVSVIVFLGIGTIPWYYFRAVHRLDIFNWAYLGAAGSITSLLLSYYQYRLVEVGNTEGKQELLRATLAGVLGLVAGTVSFALTWFNIVEGHIIPKMNSIDHRDVAGSIAFAFGAGFLFESVFEKLKHAVNGSTKYGG